MKHEIKGLGVADTYLDLITALQKLLYNRSVRHLRNSSSRISKRIEKTQGKLTQLVYHLKNKAIQSFLKVAKGIKIVDLQNCLYMMPGENYEQFLYDKECIMLVWRRIEIKARMLEQNITNDFKIKK
jgi:hypothetical protein